MTLVTPNTNPKPASCGPPAGSYGSISNAQASVSTGSLCHLQLRAPGKPPGSGLSLFHCTASATTPRRGGHGLLAILSSKAASPSGSSSSCFCMLGKIHSPPSHIKKLCLRLLRLWSVLFSFIVFTIENKYDTFVENFQLVQKGINLDINEALISF